jgi:hypothetical protein
MHIEYLLAKTPKNVGQGAPEELSSTKNFVTVCKKCNRPLDLTQLLNEQKIRYCLDPRDLCPAKP